MIVLLLRSGWNNYKVHLRHNLHVNQDKRKTYTALAPYLVTFAAMKRIGKTSHKNTERRCITGNLFKHYKLETSFNGTVIFLLCARHGNLPLSCFLLIFSSNLLFKFLCDNSLLLPIFFLNDMVLIHRTQIFYETCSNTSARRRVHHSI